MNVNDATSEQVNSIQRRQELEGQQAVALIQGAGSAVQATANGNRPPPQPVSVTPRPGSTVEVVA
jgi:hypothetical protein